MLFPQLEYPRAANDAKPIGERDVLTQCFMDLLSWLRIVILQDAVFLREMFPSLSFWCYPPFNTPLFEDFAQRLRHEGQHGRDPIAVRIANVVPHIARQMESQFSNLITMQRTCHQSNEIRVNRIETKLDEYNASIQPLSSFMQRLSTDGVDMRTRLTLEHGGSELNARPIIQTAGNDDRIGNTSGSNKEQTAPPIRIGETAVEQYRLQPGVSTVAKLWEEYDKGISPESGRPRGPLIKGLNEKYDTKWRRDEAFRRPYAQRRFIWEEVIAASANLRLSGEDVATRMDRWRSSQTPTFSLQKLNQSLKTGIQLWGAKHPLRVEIERAGLKLRFSALSDRHLDALWLVVEHAMNYGTNSYRCTANS